MHGLPNRLLTQGGLLEILRLFNRQPTAAQGPPGIWVGTELAGTFSETKQKIQDNLFLSLSEGRG